ncbi:MAG: extracellular solute-binding protein [Gammaproteobacteria bacterium]|nr:extracellular solute-binding protein [Gammaproteobacteria bacterium]
MKKSKLFVLLSLLAILSLVLVACGGSEEPEPAAETNTEETVQEETAEEPAEEAAEEPAEEAAEEAEPVTLRVLIHQNPPMVEFMEAFNAEFEAAYPNVTVDMSVVNANDLSTVTQTRLTANDIDVIDIFGFANPVQDYMGDATPPNWQTLIEAGLLMDLTDQPFVSNYDEATIRDAGSYNGQVYSINLGRVTYSGMFVNTTLLEENGVEIPTTWSELVAACETITSPKPICPA